mmetsp:Transcript_22090/g.21292  ORF Transcript_22090/g.21292 Transcript_22090/m.21292 type:complete len:114 (-) Transcript_22090:249-590(-)
MHIKGEEDDIYADEYDVSDNDEQKKYHSLNRNNPKQLNSPKLHKKNVQQVRTEQEQSPDTLANQKIRNTVYGTGFFDQRNQKLGMSKQNIEKFNPIGKPLPKKQSKYGNEPPS